MRTMVLGLVAGLLSLSGSAGAQANPTARQWFAEGLQALRAHHTAEAEQRFRHILALQLPAPEKEYVTGAWVNLGVIAMQQKRWSAALTDFTEAERLAPEVTGIRFNLGLSHFYQGDYGAAIPAFTSVLRDQPNSPQAHYFLGVCDFMTGRFAETQQMLTPLWNREQNNISYLYMLALASGKNGDTALHQKALQQLLTAGAGRGELDLIRGRAELNTNRPTVAIASLERAARLDPGLPNVHFSLGQAYQAQHQYDRAAAEYRKDLAIGGHEADDEAALGEVDRIQGHLPAAEREFKRALALQPSLVTAHAGLGKLDLQTGALQPALKEFTTLCKLVPEVPEAHYLRGRVLAKLHRTQDAKAELSISSRLQAQQLQDAHTKIAGSLRH